MILRPDEVSELPTPIYKAMMEASLPFAWAEFNARHAFLRDEEPRYDPELASRCYGRAVDLFRRKLGQGDQLEAATGRTQPA